MATRWSEEIVTNESTTPLAEMMAAMLASLPYCAALSVAAVRPTQEVSNWVRSEGGVVNVAVGPTAHGLGLLAMDAMKPGDVAVSVPRACILGAERADPSLQPLIESIPSDFWAARLAIRLLAERAKGDSSHMAPHIRSLPSTYPLPIFWTPEAIEGLSGYPAVHHRLLKTVRFISSFSAEHLATASDDMFGGVNVGADAFGWAIASCSSRAFLVGGERELVPVIDLGNHAARGCANCEVAAASGRVELIVQRPVAMGEEITYTYGALGNDDMLLDYGFVPAYPNLHDRCELAWSDGALLQSAMAAAGAEDAAVLDEHGFKPRALSRVIPRGKPSVALRQSGLEETAMAACRIAAAHDEAAIRACDYGRKPLTPAASEVRALRIAAAMVAIGITALPAADDDGNLRPSAVAAPAAAASDGVPTNEDGVDLAARLLADKRRLCRDALALYADRIKALQDGKGKGAKRTGRAKKAPSRTRKQNAARPTSGKRGFGNR